MPPKTRILMAKIMPSRRTGEERVANSLGADRNALEKDGALPRARSLHVPVAMLKDVARQIAEAIWGPGSTRCGQKPARDLRTTPRAPPRGGALDVLPGGRNGGGYEIRTREGEPPTRFPTVVVPLRAVYRALHLRSPSAVRRVAPSLESRLNGRERC